MTKVVPRTFSIKRTVFSNAMAALGVFVLLMLADMLPRPRSWHLWAFAALACALFFVANRGIWRGRSPLVRYPAALLLSVLLAVPALVLSRAALLVVQEVIVWGPRWVSGRVVDLSGQPVPNAWLSIINVDMEAGARPSYARADAEGRFTVRATRGNNQLTVDAEGYSSMVFIRPANRLRNRGWDFALPQAVSVSGRVVDTAGRPLPDRVVEIVPMLPEGFSKFQARFDEIWPPPPTDKDGHFLVAAAPCLNRIVVGTKATGDRQTPVNDRVLDLSSGIPPDPLEIVLQAAENGDSFKN